MSNLKKHSEKNTKPAYKKSKAANKKPTYRLYILFKDGRWMKPEIVKLLVDYVTKKGELEDFGTGNAYNMPDYLLDAIEGHEDTAMVICWDWEGDTPHPRFLVEPDEICPLIDALKANPKGDSWEIAVEVNRKIRAEEER